MIYVIADDLTGATDTGVQLTKQGYNTVVSIAGAVDNEDYFKLQGDNSDVLVIDSESRDLSAAEAGRKICCILNSLRFEQGDIIYKKIDSTLRGNIGVEIEEIMFRLKKDICIFVPSFPSHNRIVTGGYLIVCDEPLGVSEYYSGELDPGDASYIPSLLRGQTDLPIGRIDLKEVIKGEAAILEQIKNLYRSGKKVIVLDAVNDRQLQDILLSADKFKGSVLYAGSAGLAHFLSRVCKTDKEFILERGEDPIVIVGGSRNNIVNSQIEFLQKKIKVREVNIDVEQIFADRKKVVKKYLLEAEKAVKEKQHLILRPDPDTKEEEYINGFLQSRNMEFRKMEVAIRDFLGELTALIIKKLLIKKVIITGGDTAIGVCRALGINSLKIQKEILPGVPLSTARTYDYSNLNLITKAGGFGEQDTLYQLIKRLNDENYLEVKELGS